MAMQLSRHLRARLVAGVTACSLLLPFALRAQQPNDTAYTARIREFTTEPFFLTPLVDHLPASDRVPTPLALLGHISGARDVLTYPEDIYRYLRAVDDASDRVKVLSIGQTEEGREMIVAVVADEQTMARLEDYRGMLARLADPRRTTAAEAERLIGQGKPVYWATGAIHSPETGSPEMLMELVYRLAVEETPFIQAIRNNLITMVTPVIEVDGRAKVVDLQVARKQDPKTSLPRSPVYWGKYVAHDDNRDNLGLGLQLSRNVVRHFLAWNPTVLHDLHESASYLYTSTGRGPYNAWIDPVLISEWYRLAHREVEELTGWGVPGIYTYDFYDGWSPNYMFWIANSRNSIGRFYETQGAGDASDRIVRTSVDRQWSRPNTPLPEVVWSIRNNVNLQQSALLVALNEVASNREEYLRNFWLKSQRAVAKATTEGPAAYVLPASDPRLAQQARLLRLLQLQGIEVQRLSAQAVAGSDTFPAGSYVVRLDQPFSRTADMLLDRQYYNPTDPAPYDDAGWTLGPLYNARTVRVVNADILKAPMTLVNDGVRPAGAVPDSPGARAFLIAYHGENDLTAFRYAHRGLRIMAAEAAFEADGVNYPAGSFVIPMAGNPGNLPSLLASAAEQYGFAATGVSVVPEVTTHAVAAPRVAVVHTWTSTQNEGWLRLGLDEYRIPYDYISVHEVRDHPKLHERYDVLIFGPSTNNALSLLNGLQGDQPVPWKRTTLTPNIGRQDATDDMRGGLELQGILNLANFVKAGGTLITLQNTSVLPVHFGLATNVSIRPTPDLWAPGGVFRAIVSEAGSPLAYGYDSELGVYFNSAPVFVVSAGAVTGGGGGGGGGAPAATAPARVTDGSTTARHSSRGGIEEQDVVQGRPTDLGRAGVEEFRKRQSARDTAAAVTPNPARVIMRYAPDVKQLLISGGLRGGETLANSPALVDVSYGTGHVLLFGFNPFWRSETLGSYGLVFNALLHHGQLGRGRTAPAPAVTATR